MRAGLITFHFAHHYGAQLQAYATMKAIQGLGHGCEIIDYRLPHTTRTNRLFKKGGGVRGAVSDAHTALHYGAFQRRFERFEAFVAEQMTLSPERYADISQLRAAPPQCNPCGAFFHRNTVFYEKNKAESNPPYKIMLISVLQQIRPQALR